MTRTGFKPLNALMRESETLSPMHARLGRISRLQHSVAEVIAGAAPGLETSCRVATVENSTLVIAAANGAVAAKLKQMVPRLLAKIRENKKQEQEVTAISVVVQPGFRPPDPAPRGVQRDPMETAKLAELAESLGDSPLKEAVERIRRKRERALTPSRKS